MLAIAAQTLSSATLAPTAEGTGDVEAGPRNSRILQDREQTTVDFITNAASYVINVIQGTILEMKNMVCIHGYSNGRETFAYKCKIVDVDKSHDLKTANYLEERL